MLGAAIIGAASKKHLNRLSGGSTPVIDHFSIEEEELSTQRDAAVSLFKGLQEKVQNFVPQFVVTTGKERYRVYYRKILQYLTDCSSCLVSGLLLRSRSYHTYSIRNRLPPLALYSNPP